ncbi:MAG: LemA family protein [Ignavibacteriales bacterium]|nr:LemA family protein [Ignavibacteriales bacterium]
MTPPQSRVRTAIRFRAFSRACSRADYIKKPGPSAPPYDRISILKESDPHGQQEVFRHRLPDESSSSCFLIGALSTSPSVYNALVGLDQKAQAQWAQVENAYQRRADLIPNLVETVKGAAAFETGHLHGRDRGPGQGRPGPGQRPASLNARRPSAKFQQAQDGLSSALSRLLVVVEKYPELKATENFKELQAQLEGTENRITVERHALQRGRPGLQHQAERASRPSSSPASSARKFAEKAYFKAQAGAETAPKVKF